MKDHIEKTILYKNSEYVDGNPGKLKPFKNIIRPILNLAYRAEGFDVKDIELFINNRKDYYKSFLVKKFHAKWARENKLDTFIDDMVETYIDFGGVLVKKTKEAVPEVVHWETIAFCDQMDILSAPFAIKHSFNPAKLLEMSDYGWGDFKNGATKTLEEAITLAGENKKNSDSKGNKSPGTFIEVYEIHGVMPNSFLGEEKGYSNQMQIVIFTKKDESQKEGIVLYSKREPEGIFKFLARDKIYNRTLGFGGTEELFEDQIWTNYSEIRMKELLDAASKIVLISDDESIAAKHPKGLKNLKNLEILTTDKDKRGVWKLDNYPQNIALFDKSVAEWEAHARTTGAANEAIMGEPPTAGTPFKSVEFQAAESHSLHDYRKGKLASFMGEIYKDWIIQHIAKEITKGDEFLAELGLDELQTIAENISINKSNKAVIEKILDGKLITRDETESFKAVVKDEFLKGGNKKFIKILEGEMSKAPIDVEVNIAGKQKRLGQMVDKLVNVLRFMLSTYDPNTKQFAVFNDPRMSKYLNEILEYSGMSPINYGMAGVNSVPVNAPSVSSTVPLNKLAPKEKELLPA